MKELGSLRNDFAAKVAKTSHNNKSKLQNEQNVNFSQ